MELSSRHTLFSWGRADRAPSMSFFRVRALGWRPILRPRAQLDAAAPPKTIARLPKYLQPRAKWTPWLLQR